MTSHSQIIEAQAEKINEMAAVMIRAASFVEEKEVHLEAVIKRLEAENQVGCPHFLRTRFFGHFLPYVYTFVGIT